MKPSEIITDAYTRLGNLTPTTDDCGRLCSQACCQAQDEPTGMYLFPGEAELLPPFLKTILTSIPLKSGVKIPLAICNGHCRRSDRPLACRIFPLTPYISPEGHLTTIVDPRAIPLCPLTRASRLKTIQAKFIRAVDDVGQMLYAYPETQDFLETVSRIIDESITL